MVALVRGVHGLRGAVRVEVLTDRPEERFIPGAVLHREGSDEPLTIASAEAIPDGPGWRLRFDEVPDRSAADASARRTWRPPRRRATRCPSASTTGTRSSARPCATSRIARSASVHDVYRVGGAEVFVVRGEPYGEFDLPVVRAFIRIFAPARGEIVVDVDALALEPAKPAATSEGARAQKATSPSPTAALRREPAPGARGRSVRREPASEP